MFLHHHLSRSAAAIAAALVLTACGGTSGGGSTVAADCKPRHPGLPTVAPGTLTVAAYVSPPYTVQSGAAIEGVDGLIVKAISERECLTLTINSVAGAALPATIQSKRADVAIGGVYSSEERAATFSLTSPMYRDGLALRASASTT